MLLGLSALAASPALLTIRYVYARRLPDVPARDSQIGSASGAEMNAIVRARVYMTEDRIDWHLWNWERWMTFNSVPGRLPRCASGGVSGYTSLDWDSSADYFELDIRLGAAVQAVIDGLSQRQQIAVKVQHGIMSAVYRLRDHSDAYEQARAEIGCGLHRRGID